MHGKENPPPPYSYESAPTTSMDPPPISKKFYKVNVCTERQ
jgi:hypothetical protein